MVGGGGFEQLEVKCLQYFIYISIISFLTLLKYIRYTIKTGFITKGISVVERG